MVEMPLGLLVLPQAVASIGLKAFMPAILARLGYRNVLVANTIVVGLLIMSFATVGAETPIWRIVLQAFVLGLFTSMQYTSMNTLVYADVSGSQTSGASTIAAPASAVTGQGARRNASARTLAAAMQCRMPKKMNESGKIHHVTSVTSPAAPATSASRRR